MHYNSFDCPFYVTQHCEHLDIGCNQGIILYLDPLTPPPLKQIPEILIDNWWAIYIVVSLLIYTTLGPISDQTQ